MKISIDQAMSRLMPSSKINRSKQIVNIEYIKSMDDNDSIVLFKKGDTYILSPTDDDLNPVIAEFDSVSDEIPESLQDMIDGYVNDVQSHESRLVDLGLSVKWSSVNLGASSPEEFGNLYAWGETTPKSNFTWDNYTQQNVNNISKKYDAAYKLNKSLCIPTVEQWNELIKNCKLEDVTINKVNCCKVTGPNGNFILLPYTGYRVGIEDIKVGTYGLYDTANLYNSQRNKTFDLIYNGSKSILTSRKMLGRYIRPVSSNEEEEKDYISPMIDYKWGQTEPFNNLIPIDPSTKKRSKTGCNATAIAMIIAYWATKGYYRGCTKTEAYKSFLNSVSIDIPELKAIPTFDFNNLLKTSKEINSSSIAKTAVGTLMKYVSYAIKSNFTSSGTSSEFTKSAASLINNFKLGQVKVIFQSSGNFGDQIYKELKEGRPVIMAGFKPTGGGHAFIIDGYNAGKFHINWGWNGSYNGWFDLLDDLKVNSDYNYSYDKRAMIGINPDKLGDINKDKDINVTDVMKIVQAIINDKTQSSMDLNFDGIINEDDIQILINYILGHA